MKLGLGLGLSQQRGGRRASGPTFLLRDEFTTAAAAPLASPRTCEPGPNTLTLTDGSNKLSVTGGVLRRSAVAGAALAVATSGSVGARTAGRALRVTALTVPSTDSEFRIGWGAVGTILNATAPHFRASSGGATTRFYSAVGAIDLYTGASGDTLWLIQRAVGYFYIFVRAGVGTLVWVDNAVNTAAPIVRLEWLQTSTALTDLDALAVLTLPAPFDTEFGLSSARVAGAVAAGTAFTHPADCLIEWVQTAMPTNSSRIMFRRQDDNNCWFVGASAAGVVTLNEVVGGVVTARYTSAGGTLSAGDRVVVTTEGTTIKVTTQNTIRTTYTTATNFATLTSGKRNNTIGVEDGTISDIVVWPRTLTMPVGY